MTFLIAVIACVAVAGGIGAVIGILVGRRRQRSAAGDQRRLGRMPPPVQPKRASRSPR